MKRLVAILAACTMLVCAAASCGSSSSGGGSSAKSSASSDELSGKYFCCNKEGNSYAFYTIEFSGNKFQMKFKAFDYVGGTFETDGDKITLHLNKLTKEQLAAMNGESPDEYPDPYVDEANERAMGWFDGTYDYNVFDGNLIYISALDPLIQEQDDYKNKTRQTSANAACSSICKAVLCSYYDAEDSGKLPSGKRSNIIYSSDPSKTLNCNGLNDVLHEGIVNYFKDADKYDYIVVIDDGDYVFGACCKKGDKYVGLMTGIYKDTDFTGMTLDEIYEVISK